MASTNLAGKYSAVIAITGTASVITFDPNLKNRAFKNTTSETIYIQFDADDVTADTTANTNKLFLGLNEPCDIPAGAVKAAVKTASGTSVLLFLAKE